MIGPSTLVGGVSVHQRSLAAALRTQGVDVQEHHTLLDGDNVVRKLVRKTFGVRSAIRRERATAELVHVNTSGGLFGFMDAIVAAVAAPRRSLPLIITFHHGVAPAFFRSWPRSARFVFQRATGLIFVSAAQCNAAREILGLEREPKVIPNGYSPDDVPAISRIEARKRLGLDLESRIILSVGALEPYKGHEFLVRSMPSVAARFPRLKVVIVGQGSLEARLRRLVSQLGANDIVQFAGGSLPREMLGFWYRACDLVAVPSLSEGTPTVLFEALGAGRPVVASRVGGVPEILDQKELGAIVPPGDPKALADALIRSLERSWDEAFIARHAERYSWPRIAELVRNVYDAAMSKQ